MLTTERLHLRPFAPTDRDAFAAINADPQVMRYFQRPFDATETDRQLARFAQRQARDGFAFAAIERRSDAALIGMCGLSHVPNHLPCAPAVEIGWRLAHAAWGRGYATEAARAWLEFGFDRLHLTEIVAFTPAINGPSRRLMARIGMTQDPGGDFRHPDIPASSPLTPLVLYRIRAENPPGRGRTASA